MLVLRRIMTVINLEAEKQQEVGEAYHKVNEVNNDATETILSKCKCL